MSSSVSYPIKPGILSGFSYNTLLQSCREKHYALPAINVCSTETANAVLESAAKNNADVIIQVSNGGARFYGGYGLKNDHKARVLGALSLAKHVRIMAKEYGVGVILHTDHANSSLIGWINDLITLGEADFALTGEPLFTSHMIDLSTEPLSKNLMISKHIFQRIAPLGMGLEIELGITGGEEDGIFHHLENTKEDALYTKPEDIEHAWEELSPIGPLSIAASFGNVHGVYRPGNVHLRPLILKQAQMLIEKKFKTKKNPLHFVFHGGSGSTIDQIKTAVSYGVFKLNIDTDTQFAFAKAVGAYIGKHPEAFKEQVSPKDGKPLKKFYDPREWMRIGQKNFIAHIDNLFEILGSRGKSICQ